MAIFMCSRCNKLIDLDWHVEDYVVLEDGLTEVCWDCATDQERDAFEDGK